MVYAGSIVFFAGEFDEARQMMRGGSWVVLAGLSGMTAVALGAYGAHGLDGDDVVRGQFDTANQYHFWHSLALFGVGLLADRLHDHTSPWGCRLAHVAGLLFAAGLVSFSGPLYAATALEYFELTFLAPWGGFAFMAGWVCIALAALLGRKHPDEVVP